MVLNAFIACRTSPNRASQSPSPARLSAGWMGRLSTPGDHRRSDSAHGPNIMSHANGLAEVASACEWLRPPGSRKPRPREPRDGRDHQAEMLLPLYDCGGLSGFVCAIKPLLDGAVARHRDEPDPRGESRTGLPVGKPRASTSMVAERVGFEPTEPFGSRALQARALGQTTQPLRTERGRLSPPRGGIIPPGSSGPPLPYSLT